MLLKNIYKVVKTSQKRIGNDLIIIEKYINYPKREYVKFRPLL